MSTIKSRWKQKGTQAIIHPETEVDQLMKGDTNNSPIASIISLLLKAATTTQARSAIEAAAASHTHLSGDITNFASDVITAIGEETLSALGVRYSITTNGYICFGELFGGLILQWLETPLTYRSYGGYTNDTWPIQFTSKYLGAGLTCPGESTSTLCKVFHAIGNSGANIARIIAVGY